MREGVHRNAWNMPVLDKLNVFECASAPGMNQQGAIEGIDVSLCMRLTHYVLFQGSCHDTGLEHDKS